MPSAHETARQEWRRNHLAVMIQQREALLMNLIATDAIIRELDPDYAFEPYPKRELGLVVPIDPDIPDEVQQVIDQHLADLPAPEDVDPRLGAESLASLEQEAKGRVRDWRAEETRRRERVASTRKELREADIAAGPYPCTVPGCDKEYPTSHGLRVHGVKAHPPAEPGPTPNDRLAEIREPQEGDVVFTDELTSEPIQHEYPPYSSIDPLPRTKALECRDCPFATRKGTDMRAHTRIAHGRGPTQWEMTPKTIPQQEEAEGE